MSHLLFDVLLNVIEFVLILMTTTLIPNNPLLPFLIRLSFQIVELWLQ